MCRHCVCEVRPERGRVCLDTGAYLINFQQCSQCEKRGPIEVHQREQTEVDEDDVYEETVDFQRQNMQQSRTTKCFSEHESSHPCLSIFDMPM